ncbi:hypothetical protein Ocin01_02832 [Orchesella cincta]|uniref:Uncharacterized protein n=1 Tax=Orchesella cincta TaxID=48709 RepID=A0A1D2NF16_ORCCI|nr:hypothetical protein Ocin01_02832 [Orchesella cincta]
MSVYSNAVPFFSCAHTFWIPVPVFFECGVAVEKRLIPELEQGQPYIRLLLQVNSIFITFLIIMVHSMASIRAKPNSPSYH